MYLDIIALLIAHCAFSIKMAWKIQGLIALILVASAAGYGTSKLIPELQIPPDFYVVNEEERNEESSPYPVFGLLGYIFKECMKETEIKEQGLIEDEYLASMLANSSGHIICSMLFLIFSLSLVTLLL